MGAPRPSPATRWPRLRPNPAESLYVLQSTPAGYALYEQMGYRTVGHFTIYVAH